MIKNYLKVALRNIINDKFYSLLNIFGLTIGLTICILVGLYIWQNLNYDIYHSEVDRIYRFTTKTHSINGVSHNAMTPALIAPTLKEHFPEIENISRIYFSYKNLISYKDKQFYEKEVIFADPDFFKIFTYSERFGDFNTCLKNKNSMVLTKTTAEKYFGKNDPLGKTINLDNKIDFTITGIIEDVPENSHFTFDFVATYETLEDLPEGNYLEQWGATFGSYTYLKMKPDIDLSGFIEKTGKLLTSKMESSESISRETILQPLRTIYLQSQLGDEINRGPSIHYLYVISSIALFVLILACINFINLTTARSIRRSKEIGVRKVFGAYRLQLIRQFLGESFITTFCALMLAFLLSEILHPIFNNIFGIKLIYNSFSNFFITAIIFISTAFVAVLSGLYPAFVLTSFNPIKVIKGSIISGKSSSGLLRKGLVIFQFSISIILIIFTILINKQISYMKNFDMGFNKDLSIILELPERIGDNYQVLKEQFNRIPGVVESCASLGVPLLGSGYGTLLTPDMENQEIEFGIKTKFIDGNYMDFYDIQLLTGKRLSDMNSEDYSAYTVINETTAKKLGFQNYEDALGHKYSIGLSDGKKRFAPEVIGVVKDFHYQSLREEVYPLLFMRWPYLFKEISLKISPLGIPATLDEIEKVWNTNYPSHPFKYEFMDEKIEMQYKKEEQSYKIITTFSAFSILIACLGLLGLTFYTTEQKKKEIGIRKILGATISSIFRKFSFEFIGLVLISNVIAIPVSYLLIKRWLNNFPYKVAVGFDLFLLAAVSVCLISFLTIGFIILRISNKNPVESIRYE